jgi:Uri superfamily endonuclease
MPAGHPARPLQDCGGCYLLFIRVTRRLDLRVGSLGQRTFSPGCYVYVGSARRGFEARLRHHRRVSQDKSARPRWHIDYLLSHRAVRLMGICKLPAKAECAVSRQVAKQEGVTVPARGFGASDCRSGCPAHLYRFRHIRGLPDPQLRSFFQCASRTGMAK